MMTHPDELALTRWLDGEIGDAPHLSEHLAVCQACQERLARLADEAATWRGALALTSAELDLLARADLPGRLVAAVAASERRLIAGHGPRQLGLLFGIALAVALAWVAVYPAVEPLLTWFTWFVDPTMFSITGGVGLALLARDALTRSALVPAALLASELQVIAVVLLLAALWLYRLRPIGGMTAA